MNVNDLNACHSLATFKLLTAHKNKKKEGKKQQLNRM